MSHTLHVTIEVEQRDPTLVDPHTVIEELTGFNMDERFIIGEIYDDEPGYATITSAEWDR